MHVKKNTHSAQSYSTLGFDCFYSKILRNNAIHPFTWKNNVDLQKATCKHV